MTMIVITSDRHRRGARSRWRAPDESKRRFQRGSKNWQKSSMSQNRGRMSIERASLSQGWVFWRTPSYEIWLSLHILIPYSRYFTGIILARPSNIILPSMLLDWRLVNVYRFQRTP